MKNVNAIRDYTTRVLDDALKRIKLRISCLDWPSDREAYHLLHENYLDNLASLTRHAMGLMGHREPKPSEPRYDKDRRAAAQVVPKLPKEGAEPWPKQTAKPQPSTPPPSADQSVSPTPSTPPRKAPASPKRAISNSPEPSTPSAVASK